MMNRIEELYYKAKADEWFKRLLFFAASTWVAVMLLSQTVFAGILGGFLLNERLGLNEIIGSVIVLAGIAVTFLKPRNQLVSSS